MADFTRFEQIPLFRYGLIMADCPWQFDNWSAAGEGKNAAAKYECQDLDWIKSIRVGDWAAKDCLLWLWATNPLLPQAFEVLDAWGFQFKTAGTWAKLTSKGNQHFGTGYVLRSACEPFLIGVMGKPVTAKNVRSCIMAPVREHSRKPEKAFQEAERLVPSVNRLELFSRQSRSGWDVFGNELDKFDRGAA